MERKEELGQKMGQGNGKLKQSVQEKQSFTVECAMGETGKGKAVKSARDWRNREEE